MQWQESRVWSLGWKLWSCIPFRLEFGKDFSLGVISHYLSVDETPQVEPFSPKVRHGCRTCNGRGVVVLLLDRLGEMESSASRNSIWSCDRHSAPKSQGYVLYLSADKSGTTMKTILHFQRSVDLEADYIYCIIHYHSQYWHTNPMLACQSSRPIF